MRNFLFVVLDHRRMALLPEIQMAFDVQLDERQGIMRADVTTARDLSDAEKAELSEALRAAHRASRGSDYRSGCRVDRRRGGAHRVDHL